MSTTTASPIAEAIADGTMPGRVWMYATYRCNLACTYCLTESSPSVPSRAMSPERMVQIAHEARDLGFTDIGITGGEPFLIPSMPEVLCEVASILPTIVLTNATVFSEARLDRMKPLADLPFAVQISLDSPDPDVNDEMRAPDNFAKVLAAVPKLVERGIRVRIATSNEPDRLTEADLERLRALVRSLGVADEDHLVRPIIHRGRAAEEGMGAAIAHWSIPAELTIADDGAYWSAFGPTVRNGRMDTDLLVTRVTQPLERAATALLGLINGRPPGTDALLAIR
jgi:MoaA/NifB/PqqE/SkfB family radical SAM enzyme